jgi:hypothetical protein
MRWIGRWVSKMNRSRPEGESRQVLKALRSFRNTAEPINVMYSNAIFWVVLRT